MTRKLREYRDGRASEPTTGGLSRHFLWSVIAALTIFGASMTLLHYRTIQIVDNAQALACVERVEA